MSAHLAADLAVTLPNDRPGALARALSCVSAAGINIDGYSEMNGIVHILAVDLPSTRDCLTKAGFKELQKQEVVVVSVEVNPAPPPGCFNASPTRTSTCATPTWPPAIGWSSPPAIRKRC